MQPSHRPTTRPTSIRQESDPTKAAMNHARHAATALTLGFTVLIERLALLLGRPPRTA